MVALSVVVALIISLAVVETTSAQVITQDSYFYGQSPPVYPSPNGTGTEAWSSAYSKAAKLIAQMTLKEKNSLTAGVVNKQNGCVGKIPPITRLGFPGLCLQDAENGVRATDFVNAYPASIHVGASWNKNLTRHRAIEMGLEFRRKGVNVALGPVVGPLGRVTTGGRNWEGFSNDPYLAGQLAFETVKGMQGVGVTTSTKHFIGNEQELWRNPGYNSHDQKVESVSSNIDDKTMHELYLWPFQDALRAGTGCVMCSYQRINNSYGCQNSKTLNSLLKDELGFQGFVVTDWGAQHAGHEAALAGLDMAMPSSTLWGNKLIDAIKNGTVPKYRLDDMATRIIASWYQMKQDSSDFPSPGYGMPADVHKSHQAIEARSSSSKPIILQGAMEGHVLVKNVDNILPLKKPKLLSIFGYDARAEPAVSVEDVTNPLGVESQYANFNVWVGGGSGANSPAYLSDPFSAFSEKAYEDDTSLLWDLQSQSPYFDKASDACIVFINAFALEAYDRTGLEDDYSDQLVENVAKECQNTIVVLHNAGTRTVGSWIDNKNVKAVIFAHLPGQDSGRALVKLMYGEESFSGKLPYTVAMFEHQYGHLLHHSVPRGKYYLFPQSDFSEGVYTDYRYFDEKNIQPKFEFGFGLTYTTWEFSDLMVSLESSTVMTTYPPDAKTEQGGNPRLFDIVAHVTFKITNTGKFDAMEVAQLYVGIPGGPKKQLRGFEKTMIKQGQKVEAAFDLTRRDLSIWDTHAQKWKLQTGDYDIYVGSSSLELPLTGNLKIRGSSEPQLVL